MRMSIVAKAVKITQNIQTVLANRMTNNDIIVIITTIFTQCTFLFKNSVTIELTIISIIIQARHGIMGKTGNMSGFLMGSTKINDLTTCTIFNLTTSKCSILAEYKVSLNNSLETSNSLTAS